MCTYTGRQQIVYILLREKRINPPFLYRAAFCSSRQVLKENAPRVEEKTCLSSSCEKTIRFRSEYVCIYVYVNTCNTRCLCLCIWNLIKCQWSRKMIRDDWRWAHKRSIIPPSDRRRYRPTRWSKSTKGEQTQKRHNRSISVWVISTMYFFFFFFLLREEEDGGGRSACPILRFHAILQFTRERW